MLNLRLRMFFNVYFALIIMMFLALVTSAVAQDEEQDVVIFRHN